MARKNKETLLFNPDVVLTEEELNQMYPPPKKGSLAYEIDKIMGEPTDKEVDEFFKDVEKDITVSEMRKLGRRMWI